MRQHTVIGARIIGEHPPGLLRLAATIALNYHEKWDGSGYPNGLKGEEIPHVARVIAVADVFDALTSVRAYKPAWPLEDALALIRRESGQHFDPELVEAFMNCLPDILEIRERWAESGQAVPCIPDFVRFPTMIQPLTTADERADLLANGEARAAGQSIDPLPVVRLFTPDAYATWLLVSLDSADGDTAYGLINSGIVVPALGTVKLSDLASIVGPSQQPVMRDRYFQPARRVSEYLRLAEENGSITD